MSKLIVANWKANKQLSEIEPWFDALDSSWIKNDNQVVVAPPFPFLSVVRSEILINSFDQLMSLAVQDVSPYEAGSYTGAIATHQLVELNVRYAIVGHSERRQYFHETNQDVANKVERLIAAKITPIVCVDDDYIQSQAAAIDDGHLPECVVAYENIAAIGSGDPTSPDKVSTVINQIKDTFDQVKVMYGGSVNPGNATEYLEICDGVLVGGASLDGEKFGQICSTNRWKKRKTWH